MAFGMNVNSGADFRDIVKYDARAGRLFRVDRDAATGVKQQVDITSPTMKFAVDFGSLNVGYVEFTANGPARAMVPYGHPLPAQPQTKDEKGKLTSRPGFQVLVAGQVIGGIRELCSNAAILLTSMDELYETYRRKTEAAAGKIPLVVIASTTPVTSGTGAQKSTNYKPVFEIVGWVDRLPDMGERTVPAPGAPPADTLAADKAAIDAMTSAPKEPAMAGMPEW